jgi:hypothetical protein
MQVARHAHLDQLLARLIVDFHRGQCFDDIAKYHVQVLIVSLHTRQQHHNTYTSSSGFGHRPFSFAPVPSALAAAVVHRAAAGLTCKVPCSSRSPRILTSTRSSNDSRTRSSGSSTGRTSMPAVQRQEEEARGGERKGRRKRKAGGGNIACSGPPLHVGFYLYLFYFT